MNTGELELLDKMLKDTLSTDEDYILKLYRNDVTPGVSASMVNDFSEGSFTEANFTNYAARTLQRETWNAAVVVSNKAESSYGASPQSWTCGATGNTIYGYYVVGSSQGTYATGNTVLWAERFGTARVLANSDVLNLTPKLSLDKS